MNVLIWGADTILGHGLFSTLKDIKDGVFSPANIEIGEIFACDANSNPADRNTSWPLHRSGSYTSGR